jgi:hypothetical protein
MITNKKSAALYLKYTTEQNRENKIKLSINIINV